MRYAKRGGERAIYAVCATIAVDDVVIIRDGDEVFRISHGHGIGDNERGVFGKCAGKGSDDFSLEKEIGIGNALIESFGGSLFPCGPRGGLGRAGGECACAGESG